MLARFHNRVALPEPRPFYNIGHNTNTIDQVLSALDGGANAIEPDIQWSPFIDDLVVAHDPVLPTDSPPRVVDFFRHVARIARDRPQLALVVLDSKIGGSERGARLLRYMRETLAGTNLAVIYSVAHVSTAATFFDQIACQLGSREAIMVDQTDRADDAAAWFWSHGAPDGHTAYGQGIANEAGIEAFVDHGVALRVQRGLPSWVYIWNIGNPSDMRDAIRAGVDGIIPARISDVAVLSSILDEPEIASRVRLATRADNPFAVRAGYALFVSTLDRGGAGTNADVTFTLRGSTGAALTTTITGNKPLRFGRGELNEVSLYGDIGVPVALAVERDGGGQHDDWLPDLIHVRRTGDGAVYSASFGDWLTKGAVHVRALGQSRYRLKVFTGSVPSAGTDADVIFELRGAKGSVKRRINGALGEKFESGGVDDVFLVGQDLGEIETLTLTNDGSDDGPDWFVDRIELHRDDENAPPVVFDFNRWIDANETYTATKR